jgi:arylamine N-acetyltransferase
MDYSLNSSQIDKYMKILGVQKRAPGIESLTEIVSAHVIKIPFENISKLYYLIQADLKFIPEADRYLEGIQKYNFGGTCYSNNYYLYLLLRELGYEVKLCGADKSQPDVHIVNIVKLDGREYLVDTGNAAPFLQPLPRDLKSDYNVYSGNSRYVLKPQDDKGRSKMELYRDDKQIHCYTAKPAARGIDHFNDAIIDSFRSYSTFMNALLLTRFDKNKSLIIHNCNIIETEGKLYKKTKLNNRDDLISAVETYFAVPAEITKIGLSAIKKFKDVWD